MKLSKNPGVRTFSEAWAKRFSEVISESAGRDGRLSRSEAAEIGKRTDDGRFFSDNALSYLKATGQASVSASKLIASGADYAERSATRAAGADGRISAKDQQKLPVDLRADIRVLQGLDPGAPLGPGEAYAQLKALTQGMENWSESESPVLAVDAGKADAAVTPALVAARTAALWAKNKAAMAGGSRVVDLEPLAKQDVTEESDPGDWLDQKATIEDLGDPRSVEYGERWGAVRDFVKKQLSDLRLFRYGTVEPTYVLVGRTAAGELAGFMAGAVET